MDSAEREILRRDVDALVEALESERYRHVAGLERSPDLESLFRARSRAAHRDTVVALRADGEAAMAARVAALRADRAAAADEQAWRRAEWDARGIGPDGPVALEDAALAVPRERDAARRSALGAAVASAFDAVASPRERWAEVRARARVEVGLFADWEQVVGADALLAATDDAYRDVLGWLARREGAAAPAPHGGLDRAGVLQLMALGPWDGLFKAGLLAPTVNAVAQKLGLALGRVRVDEESRPSQWPGAHAFGARVSFRRRGGAPDWLDLLDALGRALANALGPPPHARDPRTAAAIGAVLSGLLLDRGFLVQRVEVEKKHAADVVRVLALRQLFRLRASAAALRVAVEVERGTSGATWRSAHRDALTLATLAAWPFGLHARDADADGHLAALGGAALAARIRAMLVDRYDVDWWRNPRAAEALAGILAAGDAPVGEGLQLGEGGEALVKLL
ncbi:MAG TPA: hypothetical protein VFK85_04595 [Anaeromyxobacteraceae bacterium]|nr:hypothetical protein [Anaeromyxobacteraceae bacterium]